MPKKPTHMNKKEQRKMRTIYWFKGEKKLSISWLLDGKMCCWVYSFSSHSTPLAPYWGQHVRCEYCLMSGCHDHHSLHVTGLWAGLDSKWLVWAAWGGEISESQLQVFHHISLRPSNILIGFLWPLTVSHFSFFYFKFKKRKVLYTVFFLKRLICVVLLQRFLMIKHNRVKHGVKCQNVK